MANVELVNNLLDKLNKYQSKQNKWGKLFFPDRTKNKLLAEYLDAKTRLFSMEPFDNINKGLKEISKEYGHKYEQLS